MRPRHRRRPEAVDLTRGARRRAPCVRDVFDAAAGRGPLGDRAARRRQHRHRRRPGAPAARGCASCSRRGGRVVVELAPPAASASASTLGRAALPAARAAGRSAGRSSGVERASARSPRRPGWRSSRHCTSTADRWCAVLAEEAPETPSAPRRGGLHLPAAQPCGRRPGRALARHLLRRLLPHRADQPLRPGPHQPGALSRPARRGSTASPRACTSSPERLRSRCCW